MRQGQDVLSDPEAALATEWLLANGLGGSACGTAAGARTRRLHALLVASDANGRSTTLLLSLDERLHVAGASFDLAWPPAHPAAARPSGPPPLQSFACDPFPTWRYRAGDVSLEKSLFPIPGHNAVAIRYRHLEGPEARLTLSPLLVSRDPDALQREDPAGRAAAQGVPGRVRIEMAPDRPALTLWHNGAFLPARVWLHGLAYIAEARGDKPPPAEDALIPGYIEATLAPGGALHVVAAAEDELFRALAREERLGEIPPRSLAECVAWLERTEREGIANRARLALAGAERTAREAASSHATDGSAAPPREPLLDAADPWSAALAGTVLAGLTRRALRLTLVSALPGATERGADAMRAVPALVSLRAFDLARAVLRDAVEYLDEGLAPEAFDPGDGTPRYGDPAAALWLVHAAELYVRRSEDLDLAKQSLVPALEGVMQFYRAGTRHGVRVGESGLLACGEPAIERADVNALWYHALVAMAQLARLTGRKESAAFYLAWAREHQVRFNAAFWDEKRGALFDRIEQGRPVSGLSPAQLLAARFHPPLLPIDRARTLVTTLERKLWTPLGLRDTPRGTRARTAWLGPFYSAALRAHQRAPEAQAKVRHGLDALRPLLARHANGALPEWFEVPPGGAPADLAGCAAGGDTTSVLAAAELVPLWVEELDHAARGAGTPA